MCVQFVFCHVSLFKDALVVLKYLFVWITDNISNLIWSVLSCTLPSSHPRWGSEEEIRGWRKIIALSLSPRCLFNWADTCSVCCSHREWDVLNCVEATSWSETTHKGKLGEDNRWTVKYNMKMHNNLLQPSKGVGERGTDYQGPQWGKGPWKAWN